MEKFLFEQSNFFSQEITSFLKYETILMPNWKWLLLAATLLVGFALHPLIRIVLKFFKKHNIFAKKFPNGFTAHLFAFEIERPLSWILVCGIWYLGGKSALLPKEGHDLFNHFVTALLAFHMIRLIYYLVDTMGVMMAEYAAKTESTIDDQLAPFATKSLKIVTIILGFLIILQSFGLNVMSLLAGLGLGGLALALAAQDTAANLFGSITILLDQPFKIGDVIKVKDIEGSVEEIGFRSTRVRTFYNSLITIPNATMAKENIDNLGVRPLRRIRHTVGITYETTPEKIQEFCSRVRYLICQHPEVAQETILVFFNGFADSSLNVLVNFHIRAADISEELKIQQAVFTEILELGAEIGVSFAYPTRTIYHRALTEQPEAPVAASLV